MSNFRLFFSWYWKFFLNLLYILSVIDEKFPSFFLEKDFKLLPYDENSALILVLGPSKNDILIKKNQQIRYDLLLKFWISQKIITLLTKVIVVYVKFFQLHIQKFCLKKTFLKFCLCLGVFYKCFYKLLEKVNNSKRDKKKNKSQK